MGGDGKQRYLNRKTAAKYLGVSVETLRYAIRHQGLPVTRVGKKRDVLTEASIDEWVRKNRTPKR